MCHNLAPPRLSFAPGTGEKAPVYDPFRRSLLSPSKIGRDESVSLSLYLSAPEIYSFHEDDTRTIESARADEVSLCKVEGEL